MDEKLIQPIAIIYFPNDFEIGGQPVRVGDLMRELNGWDSMTKNVGGYLWFCFIKYGISSPEIQVKKPTRLQKGEIEKVKELLREKLN